MINIKSGFSIPYKCVPNFINNLKETTRAPVNKNLANCQ